jgi:hypothetical protein
MIDWPAGRRQFPHVFELEVLGKLVNPPRPGEVRGLREPHFAQASLSGNGGFCLLDCRWFEYLSALEK